MICHLDQKNQIGRWKSDPFLFQNHNQSIQLHKGGF